MFNTDKPINELSEDKLGRSKFAMQLANAIVRFETKDNYSISLQGKWGCGKTSVLNLTVKEIEKINENINRNMQTTIVQFNPWNFTSTNQLINQFFSTLSNTLKFDRKDQGLFVIGRLIDSYSSSLDLSKYVTQYSVWFKYFPKLAGFIGKLISDKSEEKLNDVSHRKGKAEKALAELDSRILVIIDDIDRLPNEQIRLVFQLVNSVASFPNITYLLSFDKDIVSHALNDVQQCNGEEYLEKIIQMPFDVPPLNKARLNNILHTKINEVVDIKKYLDFDHIRWRGVFDSCIQPFISNLRDINRYCNVLRFSYSSVEGEVNFIDFAAICSLKLFATPIHDWIRDNKYSVIGGFDKEESIRINKLQQIEAEQMKIFGEVYSKSPKTMFEAITSLFPNFSNKVSYETQLIKSDKLHQDMRISSESKFDLYFSLSLDSLKISKVELNSSFNSMSEYMLREYIKVLVESDILSIYLYELRLNLSSIPTERIPVLLSCLIYKSGNIIDETNELIGNDSNDISVYLLRELLINIKDDSIRFKVILNMLSRSDLQTFEYILELLHIIELSHGRIAETTDHYEKLVNLSDLDRLEEVFTSRVNSLSAEIDIFDWNEFRLINMLWMFIDNDTYKQYMKDKLIDDKNMVKYLNIHTARWYSGKGVASYEVNDRSYNEFITNEDILKLIRRVCTKHNILAFDIDEIRSLVAFELTIESENNKTNFQIYEIDKRFDDWKSNVTGRYTS